MKLQGSPSTPSMAGLASAQTSQVLRIVEGFLIELENGRQPDPETLIARYPEIADELRAYLLKIDKLNQVSRRLRAPEEARREGLGAILPPGTRFGDFIIRQEVGRGGMGIVYEAEQVSLGRPVAIKILPFASSLDRKHLQRFKNEAKAAARLHHTHIVPVYAVGCELGVHYFAMQYIEGETLAEMISALRGLAGLNPIEPDGTSSWLAESLNQTKTQNILEAGTLDRDQSTTDRAALAAKESRGNLQTDSEFFRTVAQFGVQAAEALAHAHEQGILHRDIKPGNLLIDARSHLWIMDFGLARCQGETGLTLTGDLVGTLRYMSPEQALAKTSGTDERTDIYSLGVTLYELLTLEPAYSGRDRQDVMQQIAFSEPRAPRGHNPAIPLELETIVLKALAKEPAGRYESAQAMADDLRRFLDHKPIWAKRPSVGERVRKWAWRHRPLVATALGLMLVAASVAGMSGIWIGQANNQTNKALAEALTQRQHAEKDFLRLTSEVTEILFQLDSKRAAGAQIDVVRQELTQESLRFFETFLNEGANEPTGRFEKGLAALLVGNLYRVQGDAAKAKQGYEKAAEIFERLVHDFPREAEYCFKLAGCYYILGLHWDGIGTSAKAHEEFTKAAALFRQAIDLKPDANYLNSYAWFLATCPRNEFRNPQEAVPLILRTIRQFPDCGIFWNTLGVVYYRAGYYKPAIGALTQSMKLRGGGDSFDWFFLAMAHGKLGEKAEAERWFTLAKQERDKTNVFLEPVYPYQAEAEAVLKTQITLLNKTSAPSHQRKTRGLSTPVRSRPGLVD